MPQTPQTFRKFGGLRLDLPPDAVGAEEAIYLRDVEWEGGAERIRSRYGFQKLKAAEATGTYKALFAHSNLRMLATKRVTSESVKLVALDKECTEKTEIAWTKEAVKACFARYGTPTASYTYGRAATTGMKPIRFDGAAFTEPTATVDGVAGKEMPRGNFMVAWPQGGNRLVVANTGVEGGPNKAASSNSHVWFSEAGSAEAYESTAFAQLSPGDGEEITALCAFNGMVFVFKETKFFVFYGEQTDEEGKPEFFQREVSLGDGSRMKRAAMETLAETSDQIATSSPEGVFFCTTDGIYQTTGQSPTKISRALQPLAEEIPFEGPMSEFLSGSTESARWPAAGITSLGPKIIVKRYEYFFVYDTPTQAWTCWKMPNVSMAVWSGLSGGGSEASEKTPAKAETGSEGSVAWTNPANAKVADGVNATAVVGAPGSETSKQLKATEFGFAIPETATIKGIVLGVKRSCSEGATIKDQKISLVKAGVAEGADRSSSEAWPAANTVKTYGGPEDLWETTWTPAQVNAANFGAAVRAHGIVTGTAQVDAIYIQVFYSLAESSSVRPRLFVTNGKFVYWNGPAAEEQAGTREPAWQSGFYDLGSDDEKTLVLSKLTGEGNVNVAVAKDLGSVGEATTFELGSGKPGIVQKTNLTQTGDIFSHRFSGTAPWTIQRFTRYLRETETAGKRGAP